MPDQLDQLFQDPELRRLAGSISRAARLEVDADPAFRSELRRRLLREAYDRREPRISFWRRLLSPPGLAWAGATVGTLLIAAVAASLLANPTGTTTILVGCSCASAQALSLVQPIELNFSQPMDQQSVEKSISISPATSVSYLWTSPTTVKIVPVAGDLAPNTQYQVKIAAAAATSSGQQLGRQETITFVTQPAPSPTPKPVASAGPVAPVGSETALGQLGRPAWIRWAPDGSAVYLLGPGGSLVSVPAGGGQAQVLVPGGAVLPALSADGAQLGFFAAGKLQVLDLKAQKTSDVAALDSVPAALGWRASKLIWVSSDGGVFVQGNPPTRLASGIPAGVVAEIAPGGLRIAYQGAGYGLTIHDAETGKDVAVSPGSSGLLWSPDGKRLAFADGSGIQATDGQGGAAAILTGQLTSVVGAAWTSRDQLLVPAGGALYSVHGDGTGFSKLTDGVYGALQASADGTRIAFARGGAAWSASLSPAVVPALPVLGADEAWKLLTLYMTPRLAGGDDLKLSRWFAVYSEPVPGSQPAVRYNLRLVYSRGSTEAAYADQTLLVAKGADGSPQVSVQSTGAQRKAGAGPEVLSVQVDSGQVRVGFDSDLVPAALSGAVTVLQGGQPVGAAGFAYDATARTVTVSLALKAGEKYTLEVAGVTDVLGRTAATPYTLTFTAPAP